MFFPIRKAVLPVAGLGTRFLPLTKAVPKEMLPIGARPVISYVVEEARAAGITEFIFVTGANKQAIETYFSPAPELEELLCHSGQETLCAQIRAQCLPEHQMLFTRQDSPRGLGDAVLCARDLVGKEPFALLLPDMVMASSAKGLGCLAHLLRLYTAKGGGSFVSVAEVPRSSTSLYGIIESSNYEGDCFEVTRLVEKPSPETAPSCYALTGRYLLSPKIFTQLAQQPPGKGGEVQLTDALDALRGTGESLQAVLFSGRSFDCGNPAGLLQANRALSDLVLGS